MEALYGVAVVLACRVDVAAVMVRCVVSALVHPSVCRVGAG